MVCVLFLLKFWIILRDILLFFFELLNIGVLFVVILIVFNGVVDEEFVNVGFMGIVNVNILI